MQVSMDQSFFVRMPDQQINRKKLKRKFRKHIPSMINYCQIMAKKLKKRNQNQVILFPHDYVQEESTDIQVSLQRQYNQAAPYFFYLSKSNLFIDNHHLKIMEKATPVSVKFDLLGFGKVIWFSDWVQKPQNNFLIGVTNTNWILIISVLEKGFFKYRIQDKNKHQNSKIVSVYSFRDNLYIFSQKQCHVVQYNNLKNQNKGLNKILQNYVTEKKITKGVGLQKDNKFFIFSLVQNMLIMQIIQLGLLLKKENNKKTLFRSEEGHLLNLQIFPKKIHNVINQIIIVFATNKQVIIMSYYLQTEFCSILVRKINPNLSWRNFKRIQIPLLTFISRQNYLLCAIAFKYKLYFIKLWPDYCQISRRIKFEYPIEYVGQIGSDSGIIVVLNLALPDMQKKRILLTHQNKLISFNRCVNIELVDKFQLNIQINSTSVIDSLDIKKSLMIFQKKEILILNNDCIQRIVLNTWNNIYNEMVQTENIKLLKFLILLKHVKSPLLNKPESFEGLESFFPNQTHEEKQILLQYYYVMNMKPQRIDLTQSPQIMIPFIIQHKINNLPDDTIEKLMDWCVNIDKRLVQQMIIGGAECGWEIAVSQGWIRAFKIMVERGMEIQMPILKLYSMALSQKNTIISQNRLQKEQLTQLGKRYVNQIVQYILFVLTSFYTDLLGDGNNLEFKHCILVILQQQIWNFMIKFAPRKAVNIISSLFIYKCRISEINRYSFKDFLIFNKKFDQLVLSQGYSNSQILLSHMSETFNLLNGSQFQQQLLLQHSKLLILKYQEYCSINKDRENNLNEQMKIYQLFNNQADQQQIFSQQFINKNQKLDSKIYFSFRKQYLKSILLTLSKNENENLQNVYRQFRKHEQNDDNENEFECQMTDFLIYIWKQIYFKILKEASKQKITTNSEIYSFQEKGKKIRRLVKQQIRLFLAQIQQQNFKYQYLVIHVMMSIDIDNQFSSRIFNKFLKCKNNIVKNRIFSWLNQTLPQNISLQEQLIRRLKEVICINEQQSRQILQKFYKGKQKQIISKIDNDPNLQLQYVELIIKDASEVVEKYYTNLHMQLVLKLKPQELISILNINNDLVQYDIVQILKITLQMGDFQQKNQILINLYQKEGEIIKCINTYLNRIQNIVYNYIALTEKHYFDEQEEDILSVLIKSYLLPVHDNYNTEKTRLVDQISFRYEESIKLIFRQHQLHYKFIQIYLNKFTSLLQNISRQNYKYKDHYIKFISEYFGAFIILLFQRGILHHLSTWIKGYSGKLDFLLQIIDYFVEGYDTLRLKFVILKSMVRMERRILVKEIHSTLKQLQFCISSQSLCYVCNRTFNSENIELNALLFNCGHLYHKQCIDQVNGQDFCYHCISNNQYKSLIQNIEDDGHRLCLVDLLDKYKQKKNQMAKLIKDKQVKEAKQRTALISIEKKRMNRLGIYDKKVTAIENQAEIIDLKLMIEEYYTTQNDK